MDEEPTKLQAKDIKKVGNDTVHKICSSQVIANLGIAVKELVENSIDAHANVIEIKFKNYGVDGFEVNDNGSGITEENFEFVTAKHATSKLQSYSDLETLSSFGFRGEALSSLCALSNVVIVTRHSSKEIGTKLTFDHDGKVLETSNLARNVGTTVNVSNFLVTLPVRKKEFLKNHKKDFTKMIELLQQYCIVLTNVRVTLIHTLPSGSKQTVLSTSGVSLKENLVCVFGGKQTKDLIEIQTDEELSNVDDENSELTQQDVDYLNTSNFKLIGYISKVEVGRNNKDRQFYYVNSRPVELVSIKKIVNDVYHRFNPKQFPFVVLNLKIDQSDCDINLSKDKRKIAVSNDKILQLAVKKILLKTFGETPSKLEFSSINQSVKNISSHLQDDDDDDDDDDKILVAKPGNKFANTLMQWKKTPEDPTPSQETENRKRKLTDEKNISSMKPLKEIKIDSFFKKSQNDDDDGGVIMNQTICKNNFKKDSIRFEMFDNKKVEELQEQENSIENVEKSFSEKSDENSEKKFEEKQSEEELKSPENSSDDELDLEIVELENKFLNSSCENSQTTRNGEKSIMKSQESFKNYSSQDKISLSLETIKKLIESESNAKSQLELERKQRKLQLQFKETVKSVNSKAEAELKTEIKKEMFNEMKILGQFNLGFIITKLGSNLFIVDQHASDEKFNFERFRRNAKFQTQPLVVPETLDFNAVQELCIEENLSVFERFGFKFDINNSEEIGKKLKLTGKPHKGHWNFGRSDIEEIIFLLEDNQDKTSVEPSKVKKMFASKACRKSVMIGTALNKQKMQQIVSQMSTLEHPWNCPHGRPTLRYLQNLDYIDLQEKN